MYMRFISFCFSNVLIFERKSVCDLSDLFFPVTRPYYFFFNQDNCISAERTGLRLLKHLHQYVCHILYLYISRTVRVSCVHIHACHSHILPHGTQNDTSTSSTARHTHIFSPFTLLTPMSKLLCGFTTPSPALSDG